MAKFKPLEILSINLLYNSYIEKLDRMDDDYCVAYQEYGEIMKNLSISINEVTRLSEEMHHHVLWFKCRYSPMSLGDRKNLSEGKMESLEKNIKDLCEVDENENLYYNTRYMVLKCLILANLDLPQDIYGNVKNFLKRVSESD